MGESLAHVLQRRALGARRVVVSGTPSPRRVRAVARALDRLASAAEHGAGRARQARPPRSVTQLAPEAGAIREVAALVRGHAEPPAAVLAACDRFADACWNGALRGLDREYHRRELGRIRFLLLC
ncbi:MAG: hypothetical protein QOI71_2076 [Gaiellales bacterium]|nr:hypothetical protein [Gaiellales bacterium]